MTYALTSPARASEDAATQSAARAWARLARIAGLIAGFCLLAGTILFLLDATHILAADPQYHVTQAGPLHDEAEWWVAYFARQHRILWDVMTRDTLFPVAFLALMIVAYAIRRLVRDARPEAQLLVLFMVVGGVIATVNDLLYLSATDYWRVTGWSADPAARMVAIGRSSAAIESLTRWPEAAGFVILAAGLICLGRLAGEATEGAVPTGIAPIVYVEAALLLGISIAGVAHADTAYNIFSLVTGAVVGPIAATWLGVSLGKTR
jgi:hypothetical protein